MGEQKYLSDFAVFIHPEITNKTAKFDDLEENKEIW